MHFCPDRLSTIYLSAISLNKRLTRGGAGGGGGVGSTRWHKRVHVRIRVLNPSVVNPLIWSGLRNRYFWNSCLQRGTNSLRRSIRRINSPRLLDPRILRAHRFRVLAVQSLNGFTVRRGLQVDPELVQFSTEFVTSDTALQNQIRLFVGVARRTSKLVRDPLVEVVVIHRTPIAVLRATD